MDTSHSAGPHANGPLPVGHLLRDWRRRRHLTQLELAELADTSTRHVSFIETGRSLPSRAMLMRLADRLDVPLRERNALMASAGLAAVYRERPLDDPAMAQVRTAVELVLAGHEPYPALAVDRHWTMLAANRAIAPLLAGVAPALLAPPVNVLRLSLHPDGLASRIANLGQWRAHVLLRLHHQAAATGDPVLHSLHDEIAAYPHPDEAIGDEPLASVVVPLQLRTPAGVLSFVSTTTVFGTPMDITVSELAIESFFPADAATGAALRALAEAGA